MALSEKIVLNVFIDAFGWEISRRHAFLDDVLATRGPLGTIFGYSSTCDPTIVTGLLPRDHGHFSFFHHSPSTSPFGFLRPLALLPRAITSRGRFRRVVSRVTRRILGYTGYFQLYNMPFRYLPLFGYSEKRDLYRPGGINSGAPTIFDRLRDRGIPFHVSDWRRPEAENLAALRGALDRGEIAFAYLYLASMDALLHRLGTTGPEVDYNIRWYDNQLRLVLDSAHRRYRKVHLHVFSDHGMTDVTDTCDLIPRIEALGLTFGKDYAACYDSTMARFWFLDDRAREKITAALAEEPRGEILSDKRLAEYGCDFPDRKYGQLFFLMKPGVLLCPSFMGERPLAGMHGYDPYHKDSVALFASSHRPDPAPKRLDDLHDLMLRDATDPSPA